MMKSLPLAFHPAHHLGDKLPPPLSHYGHGGIVKDDHALTPNTLLCLLQLAIGSGNQVEISLGFVQSRTETANPKLGRQGLL